MRSAWGIEHGEVSKSFKRMAPKLLASMNKEGANMDQRIRHNYAMSRVALGTTSKKGYRKVGWPEGDQIKHATKFKAETKAMLSAAENRSRRTRKLP
jgi:hypothetical protein